VTSQPIRLELPEDIYRRLTEAATLTQQPLEEVLVQTIRGNLPPVLADLDQEQRPLVADLPGLDDAALWAVARAPLPAAHWRRHQRLLQKGEQGPLTPAEQAALAALREETDRYVLRRSYALALLKWRGHTVPTPP
jgi:hypothetical protein